MRENLRNAQSIDTVQLRVTLIGSNPKVFRLIHVPEKFHLGKLHQVLQISMGWTNSHLHEFDICGKRYVDPETEPDEVEEIQNECTLFLREIIKDTDEFMYRYDFGDGWEHLIEIQDRFRAAPEFQLPACVGGDNTCPPEDCGGLRGYSEFLRKLSDPRDPEHREMLAWIGGFFDPRGFDPNRINKDLWSIRWKIKKQGPC